jgi:hypothetical protein
VNFVSTAIVSVIRFTLTTKHLGLQEFLLLFQSPYSTLLENVILNNCNGWTGVSKEEIQLELERFTSLYQCTPLPKLNSLGMISTRLIVPELFSTCFANVQSLDLNNSALNDHTMIVLSTHLTQLTELNLTNTSLGDKGLQALFENCPKLTILNLRLTLVSSAVLFKTVQPLKRLNLCCCKNITHCAMIIANIVTLEHVVLCKCHYPYAILQANTNPKLEILRLSTKEIGNL